MLDGNGIDPAVNTPFFETVKDILFSSSKGDVVEITKFFKLDIIVVTSSLIPLIEENWWDIPLIFNPVIDVPWMEERSTLLRQLDKVVEKLFLIG